MPDKQSAIKSIVHSIKWKNKTGSNKRNFKK